MATDKYLRVHEAAELLRVTPQTVRKYKDTGKITGYTTPGGQTLYSQQELLSILQQQSPDSTIDTPKQEQIAFYVRSSNGDETLINSQIEQLTEKYGEPFTIIIDKASGLNDKRKGLYKLIKLAKEEQIQKIIITQQDRLTRFGFNYLEELFAAYNVEIIIAFDKEDKTLQEELMQDFMSLIASFSGKFYRLRGYEQQQKLLQTANQNIEEKIEEKKNVSCTY